MALPLSCKPSKPNPWQASETAEESLAELTQQAQDFSAKQLPILKALQIV
jgi:hypothetical protein